MLRVNNFKRKGERGSLLVWTFSIGLVMVLGTLWLGRTLTDYQHLNRRRRDLKYAYYAAEAGVEQVKHWGNHPEEYDNLDENGLFYRDPETGEFPNLTSTLNEEGEYVIEGELLAEFASKYGFDISDVNYIKLIPPDPENDPVLCLFKVESEGEAVTNATRRVLAYVEANPIEPGEIKLLAGLISLTNASQAGNGRVHWGEAWSKHNFNILNKSQLTSLDNTSRDYDPLAKYRTEARILFEENSTWKIYNPSKPGKGGDVANIYTARFPGAAPADGNYENGFEQLIPEGVLEWPDLLSKYQVFKSHAILHGRYYSTDANGNIYKDGVEDEAHKVEFDYEFHINNRERAPYDLVFIDTIDGNPPAEDGSNLATIQNSGTGGGLKGIFWIGAHYDQSGMGNRPAFNDAEKPVLQADGSIEYETVTLDDIFLDGVLYAAGTMRFQGNPRIYGSVIAEEGYRSGGTPDIYYNHKLKDGLEYDKGNLGSVFNIVQQTNF